MTHKHTANCVVCDKELVEAFPGGLDTYQPYAGGQITLTFAYGSTKFDELCECTNFIGVICDDCGEKLVAKMEQLHA